MAAQFTPEALLEILQGVEDPELGYSIVDLGLVYRAEQIDAHIEVDFTLTYLGCPLESLLKHSILRTLQQSTGIEDIRVRIVWDPPWTIDRASAEVRLDLGYSIW